MFFLAAAGNEKIPPGCRKRFYDFFQLKFISFGTYLLPCDYMRLDVAPSEV
jgi:hypothetical protein